MEYNYISLLKIFLATILIQATYCKVYHKSGVDKAFYLVKFSDEFNDSDSLVFYYQYNPDLNEMLSPKGTVNKEKYIISTNHNNKGQSTSNWGQQADNDVLKSLYSKLIPDSNSYGPKSYVAYKMEKICETIGTIGAKTYLLYKFHLKYFECESEARYFYQSLINYDKSNIAVRWSIKDNKFVESNGVFSTRVGSYPYYPDEVLMGNNTPDNCA